MKIGLQIFGRGFGKFSINRSSSSSSFLLSFILKAISMERPLKIKAAYPLVRPASIDFEVFETLIMETDNMKHAAEALSDPSFNPTQQELVSYKTFLVTDTCKAKKEISVCLLLLSADLEEFQCSKPLPLKSLDLVLNAAVWYNNDPLPISATAGCNKQSIQLAKKALDFAPGLPISIDLHTIGPEYRKFPDETYGFEAVIPSSILTRILTEVLHMLPKALLTFKAPKVHIQLDYEVALDTEEQAELHEILDFAVGRPVNIDTEDVSYMLEDLRAALVTKMRNIKPSTMPESVKLYSRPAAVQMTGNLISASILDDEQDCKDLNLVRMNWNSMESLEKALQMAVYLLTKPPENILLRSHTIQPPATW